MTARRRTLDVPSADALVAQADQLNIRASALLGSVLTLCGIKHHPGVNSKRVGDRN